jgi:hypothetical protein
MKITQISYRRLKTGTGYNNSALEATAAIEPHEDPIAALAELKFWVEKQLDDQLKQQDAYEKLQRVEDRVAFARAEADRHQKRGEAYRELLREKPRLIELARANGLGGDALLLENL